MGSADASLACSEVPPAKAAFQPARVLGPRLYCDKRWCAQDLSIACTRYMTAKEKHMASQTKPNILIIRISCGHEWDREPGFGRV